MLASTQPASQPSSQPLSPSHPATQPSQQPAGQPSPQPARPPATFNFFPLHNLCFSSSIKNVVFDNTSIKTPLFSAPKIFRNSWGKNRKLAAGWLAASWLAARLAGWLPAWMAGWLTWLAGLQAAGLVERCASAPQNKQTKRRNQTS